VKHALFSPLFSLSMFKYDPDPDSDKTRNQNKAGNGSDAFKSQRLDLAEERGLVYAQRAGGGLAVPVAAL